MSERRKRLSMWRANPHCHWCGRPTVLVHPTNGEPNPDDMATIDHLRPRTHSGRLDPINPGERRTVLACLACNQKRNHKEYDALPVEERARITREHTDRRLFRRGRFPENSRRRRQLWRANPHCHWCGRSTVLAQPEPGAPMPDDLATVDHLYPKGHPLRDQRTLRGKPWTVLACHACNVARGDSCGDLAAHG